MDTNNFPSPLAFKILLPGRLAVLAITNAKMVSSCHLARNTWQNAYFRYFQRSIIFRHICHQFWKNITVLVLFSCESKLSAWKLLPWCYNPLPGEKFSFSEWRKWKFPRHCDQNRWPINTLFVRVLFAFCKTVIGGISRGLSRGMGSTWIPIHIFVSV